MKTPNRGLAALFVTACVATFAHADATLTHHYEFNGNLLDSVGSVNGTASPVGDYSTLPLFDTSVPAGGSGQSLLVGHTADTRSGFSVSNAVYSAEGSVSLWLRFDLPASTGGQADYVLNQGTTWNTGIRLFVSDDNTNKLRFNVGSTQIGNYSAGLTQDVWHHVAATWNLADGSSSFYVNGVLVGSKTGIASSMFNTSAITVGNWSLSAATSSNYLLNQFNGGIDDLRFYQGTLTSQQIADLYANPPTSQIPEPGSAALLAGAGILGWACASRRRRA